MCAVSPLKKIYTKYLTYFYLNSYGVLNLPCHLVKKNKIGSSKKEKKKRKKERLKSEARIKNKIYKNSFSLTVLWLPLENGDFCTAYVNSKG